MIAEWVLIMIITNSGRIATTTQGFRTQDRCVNAANMLLKANKQRHPIDYKTLICVPTGA